MTLTCEALATKAELQELKEQILNLLGRPYEGTQRVDVLTQGNFQGTLLNASLVQDFELIEDSQTGQVQVAMIAGELGGNPLSRIGQLASGALGTIKDFAGLIGTGLGFLAAEKAEADKVMDALGYTFDALGEVITLDARTSAIERDLKDYQQLSSDLSLRLYEANGNIEVLEQAYEELSQEVEDARQQRTTINLAIADQNVKIREAEDKIRQNKLDLIRYEGELDAFELRYDYDYQFVQDQIAKVEQQVSNARYQIRYQIEKYDELLEYTQGLGERLALAEGTITELEDRFFRFSLAYTIQRAEIIGLREDLGVETNLRQATTLKLLARIADLEARGSLGGGVPVPVQNTITSQQNDLINFAAILAGNPPTVQNPDTGEEIPVTADITWDDILNGDSDFSNIFNGLAANLDLNFGEGVNQQDLEQLGTNITTNVSNAVNSNIDSRFEQLQLDISNSLSDIGINLGDGINTGIEGVIAGSLGALVVPQLATITSQTTPTAISSAASSAICEQVNSPTGCINTGLKQPLLNGFRDNLGNFGNALNTGLSSLILMQGNQITRIVKDNNGLLKSPTFGLQALKNAFNNTLTDKVLNGLNTALLFHNAVMLSNNITQTVGDTANIILRVLNIKDADGNSIDVGTVLQQKLANMIRGIVGAENYTYLTTQLATANRIYQAGQNIINEVTDMIDSTQQIMEETGGNVGKIGNALRDTVVAFDAYDEMREEIKANSKVFRRLEQAELLTDNLYSITSNIEDIKEAAISIKENRQEFQKELSDFVIEKKEEETNKEAAIEGLF